jgi:hypothetical protein
MSPLQSYKKITKPTQTTRFTINKEVELVLKINLNMHTKQHGAFFALFSAT